MVQGASDAKSCSFGSRSAQGSACGMSHERIAHRWLAEFRREGLEPTLWPRFATLAQSPPVIRLDPIDEAADRDGAPVLLVVGTQGHRPGVLHLAASIRQGPELVVVSSAAFPAHQFRSGRDALPKLIEGVIAVKRQIPTLCARIERLKRVQWDDSSRKEFAEVACRLRFEASPRAVQPEQLLGIPRNLSGWETLARVQDALVSGGQTFLRGDGRFSRTRGIHSIRSFVRVSRCLWAHAETVSGLEPSTRHR